MKRKLCSVLLALCMVLTLLPVSALAEGETEPVAAIGETTYKTFDSALYNAKAGDTITLLDDITVHNTDTNMWRTVIDKPITLNLNDKTIKSPDNMGNNETNYAALFIAADVTINATTGGINTGTNGAYGIEVNSGATLTINGGNYYGGGTAVQVKEGTLVVNDGAFACEPYGSPAYGYKYLINCIDNAYKNGTAKVVIKGGSFENFDPSNSASENPNGNFCAPGYVAVKGGSEDKPVWTVEDHRVAEVNGTGYTTLAAAVSAANSGDTVTLLKDVTEGFASKGQNLVLDLNGHTWTGIESENERIAFQANAGNVTIEHGTIIGRLNIYDSAKVTIAKDATVQNTSLNDASGYGAVVWGDGTYGTDSCKTPELHVYGKIQVTGKSFAISTNGNDRSKAIIKVYDGAQIESESSSAIYLPSGALTVSGGSVTGTTAVYFKSTDMLLSGGTFIGNGIKSNYVFNGNGANATGDAIVIDNCNYPNNIGTVSITGGSFTSTNANAVGSYVGNGVTTPATKFISGGTYSSDPTAYVADGSIARVNSDGTFTVVAKAGLKNGTYTTSPEGGLASGYSYYQDGNYYTVYRPAAPSTSTSTTTKNPDGSTTTTTTDKATGTVTETTKNTDGSTTTVETKKDGSVTETNKTANGSVGTIKSDANGNSEISASISAADVSAAEKKNEPVAAPVSVAPAATSASAPVIKLSVPASAGEVSVVIPVTNAQQGTVAVKVNPDGTEEIIKTSVVTENGVVLGVEGNAQIKIVNNDKDFIDTVGHWAESDVDFVSARELFTGTAPQTFSPEDDMTRGMVVTVLARLAGASTDGGANWYDKGCEWAVANGVSDGSNPNGSISREQLAAMLYRYFGSPAVSGSLSFADASAVSEYAHDAMLWCVNNGIINGMDGLLNPQGQATRAQVSAMFARYICLMASK